ncbi:hypothetical protein [Halobacillus litoralis]|nr:hypothetical protein [Halobacillus litoralis]
MSTIRTKKSLLPRPITAWEQTLFSHRMIAVNFNIGTLEPSLTFP